MEWHPIETAPKDGTEVLAYREDADVFITQYGACDIFPMTEAEIEKIDEDSYWQENWWTNTPDGAFRLEGDLVPTRWQPVPQPPKEAA